MLFASDPHRGGCILSRLQELAGYKHKLHLQTSQAADLNMRLEQQSEQCRELSLQMANTTSKLESLQTELLLTQRDNIRLNNCIDDLECMLEKLESNGRDLMKYTGRSQQHASSLTRSCANLQGSLELSHMIGCGSSASCRCRKPRMAYSILTY